MSTTSSISQSHAHTLCVPTTDLTSPPAAGMTYTTSTTSEHAHTVTLTAAQLRDIEAGLIVTVESSSVVDPENGAAHTHTFAIVKIATVDAGAPDAALPVDSGSTTPGPTGPTY